jgi:putative membrane protein
MVMNRIARLGILAGLLLVAPELGVARAQESGTSNEPRPASSELSPVDHDFVAQAHLGAPFQVDSGRLADKKALTPALREYARLMADDYGPQKDALDRILHQKGIEAPPQPLLQGAYRALLSSLEGEENVIEFERNYMSAQVEYQKGSAELFQNEIQNGTDADLKEFAQTTLAKIEDHLQRITKVAADVKRRMLLH